MKVYLATKAIRMSTIFPSSFDLPPGPIIRGNIYVLLPEEDNDTIELQAQTLYLIRDDNDLLAVLRLQLTEYANILIQFDDPVSYEIVSEDLTLIRVRFIPLNEEEADDRGNPLTFKLHKLKFASDHISNSG